MRSGLVEDMLQVGFDGGLRQRHTVGDVFDSAAVQHHDGDLGFTPRQAVVAAQQRWCSVGFVFWISHDDDGVPGETGGSGRTGGQNLR